MILGTFAQFQHYYISVFIDYHITLTLADLLRYCFYISIRSTRTWYVSPFPILILEVPLSFDTVLVHRLHNDGSSHVLGENNEINQEKIMFKIYLGNNAELVKLG